MVKEECDCKVTGGFPGGFTIACDSNEARDKVAQYILNNAPRFTGIGAGTKLSMVVDFKDIESQKEKILHLEKMEDEHKELARELIGHLLLAGVCWPQLGSDTKEYCIDLAKRKMHDPMLDKP